MKGSRVVPLLLVVTALLAVGIALLPRAGAPPHPAGPSAGSEPISPGSTPANLTAETSLPRPPATPAELPAATKSVPLLPREIILRVLVQDRAAAPVAGATVALLRDLGTREHWPRLGIRGWAVTDRAGQAEFAEPEPGEGTLASTHPALGRASARVTLPRADRLAEPLVLESGPAVYGRVSFPDGTPAAGAEVFYRSYVREYRESWTCGTVQADEAGRYLLHQLHEGHLALTVLYNNRRRLVEEFDLVAGQGPVERDLVLRNGWVVPGRVADKSGRPIEGAKIVVYRQEVQGTWQEPEAARVSGASGEFVLTMHVAGKYFAKATHEKYCPALVTDLVFSEEVTSATINMVMERAHAIEGMVVDPDTLPIPGAEVAWSPFTSDRRLYSPFARENQPELPRPVAESDREGRFRLWPVPHRDIYNLSAQAAGYNYAAISVPAGIPRAANVRIVLEPLPRRALVGTVRLASSGSPYAGATVEARLLHDSAPPKQTITDQRGSYRFEGLLRQYYSITASAPGGLIAGPEVSRSGPVGATPERVDLNLVPSGTVRGRVVHALTGEPLEGVIVELNRIEPPQQEQESEPWLVGLESLYTNAAGQFAADGLGEGDYAVHVRYMGFEPFETNGADLEAPGVFRVRYGQPVEEVLIELMPLTAVIVEARYKDGSPAAGLIVELGELNPDWRRVWTDHPPPPLTTDVNGILHLQPVRPEVKARILLFAQTDPQDYATHRTVGRSERVTLAKGEQKTVIITVPGTGALSGRVLNQEGLPVEGATVNALAAEISAGQDTTDANGDFRLAGFMPAEMRLYVYHPDYATYEQGGFDVQEGAERSGILVRLERGYPIAGQVVNGKMEPWGVILVSLLSAAGDEITNGWTDMEGKFKFEHLPAGQYGLHVTTKGRIVYDPRGGTVSEPPTPEPVIERLVTGVEAGTTNLWVVMDK